MIGLPSKALSICLIGVVWLIGLYGLELHPDIKVAIRTPTDKWNFI